MRTKIPKKKDKSDTHVHSSYSSKIKKSKPHKAKSINKNGKKNNVHLKLKIVLIILTSAGLEEEVKRNEIVRKSETAIVREPTKKLNVNMEPLTERITRSDAGILWLRPEITAISSQNCDPSGSQALGMGEGDDCQQ